MTLEEVVKNAIPGIHLHPGKLVNFVLAIVKFVMTHAKNVTSDTISQITKNVLNALIIATCAKKFHLKTQTILELFVIPVKMAII